MVWSTFKRAQQESSTGSFAKGTEQRSLAAAAALLALTMLAGCEMESQLMTEPQSSGTGKTATASAPDQSVGEGCELKNPSGTGRCEDGRGSDVTPVKRKTAARESDVWDCNANDLSSSENSKFLDLYNKGDEYAAFAFCASVTSNNTVAIEVDTYSPPSVPDSSPVTSVPQDGTWYCDNLSGSGQYGTWEMTQHPEMFDVSSCYRVD